MGWGAPCTPRALPSPGAGAHLPQVHRSPVAMSPQPRQKAFGGNLLSILPAGQSWSMRPGSSPHLLGARQPPLAPLRLPEPADSSRQHSLRPSHAAVRAAQGKSGCGKAIAWDAPACPTFLLNIAGQVLPFYPPEPARERLSLVQLILAWDAEPTITSLPSATVPIPQPQRHLSHPCPRDPRQRGLSGAEGLVAPRGGSQMAGWARSPQLPPHREPTQK